jgi:hypothetical protein
MNNNDQLSFNFDELATPETEKDVQQKKPAETPSPAVKPTDLSPKKDEPKKKIVDTGLKPLDIKRAVLAWLISQKPSGIGLNIPTRVSKYCADIAAFWSSPAKKRLMAPQKTVIVEIRKTREQCWPDCSRQEELLPLLRAKKDEKLSIEALLQQTEPELKDSDTLFPEYESWDYKRTKNSKYHKCLKQIEDLEHALYKGSRFEQIRRAHVADYLYLAVPAGTVLPNELADGWGLININPDMTIQIVKDADRWECPDSNKLHLIQHIAAGCRKSLLFSLGVNELSNGDILFTPSPRKRRKGKYLKQQSAGSSGI